jgi:hypothetical protein
MSYEIQYDEDTNTSKYIDNGLCVATLDFDNDVFESFLDEDVEQSILDDMYDEMVKEKNRYDYNCKMYSEPYSEYYRC